MSQTMDRESVVMLLQVCLPFRRGNGPAHHVGMRQDGSPRRRETDDHELDGEPPRKKVRQHDSTEAWTGRHFDDYTCRRMKQKKPL
jgi:hypothetical protein